VSRFLGKFQGCCKIGKQQGFRGAAGARGVLIEDTAVPGSVEVNVTLIEFASLLLGEDLSWLKIFSKFKKRGRKLPFSQEKMTVRVSTSFSAVLQDDHRYH